MNRFEVALDMVSDEFPEKVLDIGSYDGEYSDKIQTQFHCQLVGIEKDQRYIDQAIKIINPMLEFRKSDFEKEGINEKFDGVFLLEVLEHFKNPYTELKKIYNCLNNKGWLILSTPDAGNYKQVIINLLPGRTERVILEKRGDGTETDHIYCWNKLTLLRLLLEVGFKFEEFRYGGSSLIFKVVK